MADFNFIPPTDEEAEGASKRSGFAEAFLQARKQKAQIEQEQREKESFQELNKDLKPGEAVSVGKFHKTARTPYDPLGLKQQALEERHERFTQKQAESYGKQLEKSSEFTSLLKDLENSTNQDGNGGVLTNPQVKLKSTGMIMSALPDRAVGALEGGGSLLHTLGIGRGPLPEEGASDERKIISRVGLAYNKSIQGLRGTDSIIKREKDALGFINSGDPDLVAKGLRSLARTHVDRLHLTGASYSEEAKQRVHDALGGDPKEMLGDIYNDYSPKIASTPIIQGQGQAQARVQMPAQQTAQQPGGQPDPRVLQRIQELERKKQGL